MNGMVWSQAEGNVVPCGESEEELNWWWLMQKVGQGDENNYILMLSYKNVLLDSQLTLPCQTTPLPDGRLTREKSGQLPIHFQENTLCR